MERAGAERTVKGMTSSHSPTHVVIAGGGVAAVECALALRDLAGNRVRLTLIAPETDFELRSLRTAEPFARDHVRRHPLKDLAAHVGAELVVDAVAEVEPEWKAVRTAGGDTVHYDALVLATGARHRDAFRHAMTFNGDRSTLPFNGLLADIDEGYSHAVSFVVPPGTTWPLPLYELALMTAAEAWGMGIDDLKIQVMSPEASPLALFGPPATAAVAALLDQARVAFRGDAYVREASDGTFVLAPSGESLDSQRIVALPTIEGVRLDGVPVDASGFVPVDEYGRVRDLTDVYAAGDGTAFGVKQGGLACQQADAVAELLASAAGAPVQPRPFKPVLRGRLLTGRNAQYLERALHGGAGDAPSEPRLWSAAHKVEGRYLSPWLLALEGTDAPAVADADAASEGLDVEVELPHGVGAATYALQ